MRLLFRTCGLLALAFATGAKGQASPPAARAVRPATAVEEVVVTAQTPPTQALIDRKVYSVASDLQATSGSAAEVLNTVPSVAVDADGNVSLRGDSNVT